MSPKSPALEGDEETGGGSDSRGMAATVIIETDRLVLRTVTIEDIHGVASSWRLDEGPISREEAQERIDWMQANHAQNAPGHLFHLCLAVVYRETQEFIGWCGLDQRDRAKDCPDLFYLLKQHCWGRGLATEAAGALIRYAFEEMALVRIHGGAAHENLASKRVMEKIGMVSVGLDEEGGYSFMITREGYLQTSGSSFQSRKVC